MFSPLYYSALLIASIALILVALIAGYNPETIPTTILNRIADKASHVGIVEMSLPDVIPS